MKAKRLRELYDSKAISLTEYKEMLSLVDDIDIEENAEKFLDAVLNDVMNVFDICGFDSDISDFDLLVDILSHYDLFIDTSVTNDNDGNEIQHPDKLIVKDFIRKNLKRLIDNVRACPGERKYSLEVGRFKFTACLADDRYTLEQNNIELPEGMHNYTFKVEFIACRATTAMPHVM